MASPLSLLLSRNWTYNVFASFHGPDVRKTLLSHMREQFSRNGITMFDDQDIVRGATIAPSLKEAIKESRILMVILSKKYASSSWCLDELVEILECKEAMGQIVMTVFYGVDPSDVRKLTGDFGIAFSETFASKTEEERRKWSKALTDVGNIAGEDFHRWDNEANMIKKIARDVSDILNATPSRDFHAMVGLDAHLREMEALLDLDNDEVKMVAITGTSGIGKTTIARALHCLLSNRFQLTCFVDNLREIHHSGFDEYGLKLRLQEQFLSNILNQNSIRVCHLGVIEERLRKARVLIILDDVYLIEQLEALANEKTWFGPGSRIVVTTENKELLQQHRINNIYHVGFPSYAKALEILCRNAFRQNYPRNGFEELAERVTKLCGKLPLGLRVVGSSLRGKQEDEWEDVLSRLDIILDRDIEKVLRVSYETLDENEQTLFLHIAIFFWYEDVVKTMFADSDMDVRRGLKILVNRSLIEINEGTIMMHKLLQQMARQTIHKQEFSKRQILIKADEICDVLENETRIRAVSGISFDISGIDELFIGKKAFRKMPNLRFLDIYKSKDDGNDIMHIPEEMEFPRRLRLLRWDAYPRKCLPPTFHPEYLVELDMRQSKLEYLWQGTQKLTNLRDMDLSCSYHLKELPDLSNATNLETLNLSNCESLVEIPSSFSHLHKLEELEMRNCINLEVIPAGLDLASLRYVYMKGCPKLRSIPIISTHIEHLWVSEADVEDVHASISLCSRLETFSVMHTGKLKGLRHLPISVKELDLSYSDIERLPDCIKALHQLWHLNLSGCRRLASLPDLPSSLIILLAKDCESLETVFYLLNTCCQVLKFTNCFKLGKQARRAIVGKSIITRGLHPLFWPRTYRPTWLPGRKVPVEFKHRARGNSLTIPLNAIPLHSFTYFMVCVVVSPSQTSKYIDIMLNRRMWVTRLELSECFREEHLLISSFEIDLKFYREVVFKCSSSDNLKNIEWGLQICSYDSEAEPSEDLEEQVSEKDEEDECCYDSESEHSDAFEDQVSENDDDDDCSYDEFESSEASQDSLNCELTDEEENLEGENHILVSPHR